MNRFILTDKYSGEIVQELSRSPILEPLRHKPRRSAYRPRKTQRWLDAQVRRDAILATVLAAALLLGASFWAYALH